MIHQTPCEAVALMRSDRYKRYDQHQLPPHFTKCTRMPRHESTAHERARGRDTRAANFRKRRERADEELVQALDTATYRLIELIDSPDPAIALRAVAALLDRVLGRPRQTLEHSGSLSIQSRTEETLRARAKLDRLIQDRAQDLAETMASLRTSEGAQVARTPANHNLRRMT
jgi:hypothetical protein